MGATELDDAARCPRPESIYRIRVAPARPEGDEDDPAMILGSVVLLAASLLRLAPPLAGREAFGAEPTLALIASLGCGWAAVRGAALWLRERRARGGVVQKRSID